MFENIINFFKNIGKNGKENSKETAKERLHLVLAQDRANISADFLEMMKQEIIEVIKKYIEIDEKAIDVRLTNKSGDDGTVGAPSLYANIPIVTIKNEARKIQNKEEEESTEKEKEEDLKQIEKNINGKIVDFKFRDKSGGWGLKGSIIYQNKRNQHQRYYNIYKTLNYIFIHLIYSIFQFIQSFFHCFRLKA